MPTTRFVRTKHAIFLNRLKGHSTLLGLLASLGMAAVPLLRSEDAVAQPKKSTASPQARPNGGPSGGHKVTGGGSDGQARKVSKDTNKLDFEDANIDGQVRNPFASFLSSRDGEMPDGFLKIRKNWHDKMAQSVSGLSQ